MANDNTTGKKHLQQFAQENYMPLAWLCIEKDTDDNGKPIKKLVETNDIEKATRMAIYSMKKPMTITTWDNDSFYEMTSCIDACMDFMTLKQLDAYMQEYDTSMTDTAEQYVKDSYMNSHAKLSDMLKQAINTCGYAVEKWQHVIDARAEHVFKSTESAFLYNDLYITPCMLRDVISCVWLTLDNDQQKAYINKFYGDDFENQKARISKKNKVTNQTKNKIDLENDLIATDILDDFFNKNDLSRMAFIDELRKQNMAWVE